MNKTSDYIEFDKVNYKANLLLKDPKKCVLGFYLIFSINTGLRISDTLRIKHGDITNNNNLVVEEKKTKKNRTITLNNNVINAYKRLKEMLTNNEVKFNDDDFVFVSQKGTVYRTQSINEVLKQIFNTNELQVSSHSLRKAFGRRIYENNNESENALVLLSDIFGHSSIAITRRYIGIRQRTIENAYLTL